MDFTLSEDHRTFRDMVRRWVEAEAPKDWARNLQRQNATFPHELWEKMARAGFHGIGIPEEFGGQGGDVIAQMILSRELARTLSGLLYAWAPTSFAGAKTLTTYGSPAQKERFLPDIAAGRCKVAISFTEPGGGTDVLGALRTFAHPVEGGWRISGEKIWTTTAGDADYLLLLARTHKDVERNHQGVSLFLVPRRAEGVECTRLDKLGLHGVASWSVRYDNVFVPDDLLLGEAGQAWYMLLPTLNNERILVGAQCLGTIDGVLEAALDHLRTRQAFGGPIGRFQALQHMVADIAIWQMQIELLMHHCAWLQTTGRDCGLQANMLKMVASDAACKAADMGIQILGGMGYSAETDMQRYWRDSRIMRIGPITNEMVRNAIAGGLGLPRSH
jgi:acyl-CoA dehydrogenase